MTNVQKKLNRLLTVVMVLSILACLGVCTQVIQGKEASILGFRIYNILTGSMEPTIPTGTSVLVHKVDALTLEEGDIITFTSRDPAIYGAANTHRIVGVEKDPQDKLCFRTKGDANREEDAQLVYPEDIQGKVVFHWSAGMASFLGYLHTRVGFITVILLPMAAATALFMRDFKRQVKDYIKESAMQELTPETESALKTESVNKDEEENSES